METIKTFDLMQIAQAKITEGFSIDRSMTEATHRLQEEAEELREAIEANDRGEIGGEIADCILILSTIASYYGLMIDEEVTRKLTRNFHKYNPVLKQELLDQGVPSDQLFNILKSKWTQKNQ